MADQMTRQEFADYMMAFERRLDARFAHIDQQFAQVDQQFAQVDRRFAQVDQRFTQVDQQFAVIDRQFAAVGQLFTDLKQSMTVQFEDVRRDIRFSLEAVTSLREMTERGFDDMRREHGDQTSLLKGVVRHVRRRVETLEPPRARTKPRPPSP